MYDFILIKRLWKPYHWFSNFGLSFPKKNTNSDLTAGPITRCIYNFKWQNLFIKVLNFNVDLNSNNVISYENTRKLTQSTFTYSKLTIETLNKV